MSTRLSVNINDECAVALRDLSARRGVTVTEVIRRAISVYKFVEDKTAEGCAIKVCDADGEDITLDLR